MARDSAAVEPAPQRRSRSGLLIARIRLPFLYAVLALLVFDSVGLIPDVPPWVTLPLLLTASLLVFRVGAVGGPAVRVGTVVRVLDWQRDHRSRDSLPGLVFVFVEAVSASCWALRACSGIMSSWSTRTAPSPSTPISVDALPKWRRASRSPRGKCSVNAATPATRRNRISTSRFRTGPASSSLQACP